MAAFEETSGYCKACEKSVTVKPPGTNHVLHFILSIFTMGLWLFIWLLSVIKFGGWYCSGCKSRKVSI